MRAEGIVLPAPMIGQALGFTHRGEQLGIEELGHEPAVERLGKAVLLPGPPKTLSASALAGLSALFLVSGISPFQWSKPVLL